MKIIACYEVLTFLLVNLAIDEIMYRTLSYAPKFSTFFSNPVPLASMLYNKKKHLKI